jgi:hypothetical protein
MRQMKLADVVAAINEYDHAMAADSYGAQLDNLHHAVRCMPLPEKRALAELVREHAKAAMARTKSRLRELNINAEATRIEQRVLAVRETLGPQ